MNWRHYKLSGVHRRQSGGSYHGEHWRLFWALLWRPASYSVSRLDPPPGFAHGQSPQMRPVLSCCRRGVSDCAPFCGHRGSGRLISTLKQPSKWQVGELSFFEAGCAPMSARSAIRKYRLCEFTMRRTIVFGIHLVGCADGSMCLVFHVMRVAVISFR